MVTDPLEPAFDGAAEPLAKPRYLAVFSVTTPVGQKSADWLKTLTPDMVAKLPQAQAFKS